MTEDLHEYVQSRLRGPGKRALWRQMASALDGLVSYSLISKIGTGEYKSSPSYNRLRAMADYLRETEAVSVKRSGACEECNT